PRCPPVLPDALPISSDDLPDPETPLNTTKLRLGMRTSTLRRLCSAAPWIQIWSSSMPARAGAEAVASGFAVRDGLRTGGGELAADRKSTRLNSSHVK